MSLPKYPPLLLKYLKMFQDDPTSRIFAPLAECYRKIGLLDEAIEICKEGLVANPTFAGGKVALARAYSQRGMHKEVIALLKPLLQTSHDNLLAQRLYADSCLVQGQIPESLSALKMILYFNPSDHEVEQIVAELETQAVGGGGLLKSVKTPARLRRLMKLQKMLNRIQIMN